MYHFLCQYFICRATIEKRNQHVCARGLSTTKRKKPKPRNQTARIRPPPRSRTTNITEPKKKSRSINATYTNVIGNRHKRTHDRGDGTEGNLNLSGEDEEEYSGEDQLGSLEEASPSSEGGYVPASLNSMAHGGTPTSNGMGPGTSMPHATFNSLQTLSMPMTISQPQPINAGGMM